MVMTADQARDGVNPITVTYLFHDVVRPLTSYVQHGLQVGSTGAILHEENVLSRRTLDPHRNPTVGFGSHGFHIDGTIRPGAFSVVAGAQIIRTSSSSASPYVHSPFHCDSS